MSASGMYTTLGYSLSDGTTSGFTFSNIPVSNYAGLVFVVKMRQQASTFFPYWTFAFNLDNTSNIYNSGSVFMSGADYGAQTLGVYNTGDNQIYVIRNPEGSTSGDPRWAPNSFQYFALFLPNALDAVSTPIRQSPKALDEVSSSLGLSTMQTLRKVVLPIAGPGIFAATTLVILTVLKELPATLLLRPTGMETLATRLWTETSVAAFSAAAPYALLLVVLAGFPAWLLNRAIRKDLEPMEMERYQ
jgi:hypothetical protein